MIGVEPQTAGGGGNVWTYDLLRAVAHGDTRFVALPAGASFDVAVRQIIRSGPRAGLPLEDLGVTVQVVQRLTEDDLFARNKDLLERAVQELRGA